jgi:hypothetical protein
LIFSGCRRWLNEDSGFPQIKKNIANLFGLESFLYSAHDHLLERSVFFVIAIIIVLEHTFQPTLSLLTCQIATKLRASYIYFAPWPVVLRRWWLIPTAPGNTH